MIIGLLCENYSRVSPGKLFLSPFQAAYIEISGLGNSSLEQTPPHQSTHLYTWVKRRKCGTKIRQSWRDSNPDPRVLPLDHRPHRCFFLVPTSHVLEMRNEKSFINLWYPSSLQSVYHICCGNLQECIFFRKSGALKPDLKTQLIFWGA